MHRIQTSSVNENCLDDCLARIGIYKTWKHGDDGFEDEDEEENQGSVARFSPLAWLKKNSMINYDARIILGNHSCSRKSVFRDDCGIFPQCPSEYKSQFQEELQRH